MSFEPAVQAKIVETVELGMIAQSNNAPLQNFKISFCTMGVPPLIPYHKVHTDSMPASTSALRRRMAVLQPATAVICCGFANAQPVPAVQRNP